MTVESQIPYQSYTANGLQTSFTLGFYVDDKNHFGVKKNDQTVSNTDYGYDKNSNSITFNTTPNKGDVIEIRRTTSADRATTYATYNNSFRPEVLNKDIDRIWLRIQELGVADVLLKLYIDKLHIEQKDYIDHQDQIIRNIISDLTNYVNQQDNNQKVYFEDLISQQGISLQQLSDYYNNLLQGIANIAAEKGWLASLVLDENGKTQQEINNILLREFNVLNYGADPSGVKSSHQAFKNCAAAVKAAGGGKIVFPFGHYKVGKQTRHIASESGYTWQTSAYEGEDVFSISNSGSIVVELQGCSIKFEDNLKYGRWDAETQQKIDASDMPFVNHNKKATIGAMFSFVNNKSVSIIGSADLDGNMDNYDLGGLWGDLGRQCSSYGILFEGNSSHSISAVIRAHHFGLDGLYVGGNRKDGTEYKEGDDAQNGVIMNYTSEYNGRQGLSHTGGAGTTYISCKFNHIGRGRFSSAPAAGVDVEAESGISRDVLFINCEFMNCVGQAVTESTGNNSRVKFIDCKMVGTTNYVGWFMKGEYRNCLIVGKFGAGNARAGVTDINQPDKKAEFYRCVFSDDTRLSPTGIIAQGIMGMASEAIMRVRYEECEWHTYNTSYMFGYTSNDPQSIIEVIGGKWVIHEGSTLTGTNLVQYYSSRLENFEFIDERSVVTELDITVAKDYKSPWKNVSFKSATGKFRGSWTGAILPTDKKRYVLNDITSISDANRDDFSPVWAVRLVKGDYNNQQTRDNLHTVTTKIIGSSAVSSIPTDSLHNPFGISDRVINNSPTDTSWTESICTKAGYTCSTAWGASTDYSLNAYINANGNVYRATIAGTSSTVAPSHTSGDMVDGTVTWTYVGALAIFRTIGVKGTAVADNNYSLTSTPTIEELVSALAKVQSELRSLKSSVKTAGYIL